MESRRVKGSGGKLILMQQRLDSVLDVLGGLWYKRVSTWNGHECPEHTEGH